MLNIEFKSSDIIYVPDGFTYYSIDCYDEYQRIPGMGFYNDERDQEGQRMAFDAIKKFLSLNKKNWVRLSCYRYVVEYWGSDPDEGNDDCWCSYEFLGEAEAEEKFISDPTDTSTHTILMHGPMGTEKRRANPRFKEWRDDDEWTNEIRTQDAMMGDHHDFYNEEEIRCTCDDPVFCRGGRRRCR